MVEEAAWRRHSPAVGAGDFPESRNGRARAACARGRKALEEGDWQGALEHFQQALESDSEREGTWHDCGLAHYRLGQWEPAMQAFDQGLRRAPDDAELLYMKGLCQIQLGLARDAEETLEQAASSGHLEARFQTGLLLARQGGQRREARRRACAHLEAILDAVDAGAEYPGLDRVCLTLGGLYHEDPEQRARAIRVYRRGLALNPLSAPGHNSLGLLLMEGGQVLGALGEFKVAIQLDPSLRAAYTNLARLLFHHVKPADLAQEFAHISGEFGGKASQVIAQLSLELVELGKQQVYESLYTKGHQLKNLMGMVGSRMRGLSRRSAEGEQCEEELAQLGSEHERLYEEWVGFLGAMKPERVHPAIVEPAHIARRVAELVRSQSWRAELKVRVQEGVPRMEADERMLREALTNLCLNALEALEESGGGQVVVGVGYDEGRSLVFFEVEDDGPGIAPEHLEHIFDPGFTTKEQGNGYGLSIARRIARAHHGELRVKSRLGHGTVFRMDLPLNGESAASEAPLSGYLH